MSARRSEPAAAPGSARRSADSRGPRGSGRRRSRASRSRLLAAITRTSTSIGRWPPSRDEALLLQHAQDLALGLERHVGDLVEQQRAAVRRARRCRAGAAARRPRKPASQPNSSTSMRSGAMVAALITTNGASARRELAWISRATTSLPTPGGPVISTRLPVSATRCDRVAHLLDRAGDAADQLAVVAELELELGVLALEPGWLRAPARSAAAAGRR